MTADEAFAITQKMQSNRLLQVYNLIKAEAMQGRSHLTWAVLSEGEEEELKTKGYRITHEFDGLQNPKFYTLGFSIHRIIVKSVLLNVPILAVQNQKLNCYGR